jgi:hypothetical protein
VSRVGAPAAASGAGGSIAAGGGGRCSRHWQPPKTGCCPVQPDICVQLLGGSRQWCAHCASVARGCSRGSTTALASRGHDVAAASGHAAPVMPDACLRGAAATSSGRVGSTQGQRGLPMHVGVYVMVQLLARWCTWQMRSVPEPGQVLEHRLRCVMVCHVCSSYPWPWPAAWAPRSQCSSQHVAAVVYILGRHTCVHAAVLQQQPAGSRSGLGVVQVADIPLVTTRTSAAGSYAGVYQGLVGSPAQLASHHNTWYIQVRPE